MLLFRRRPKEKEGAADAKGAAPEGSTSGHRDDASGATRPPSAGRTTAPAPSGAPPPLPRRAPESASADVPETYSRCFVCGSTLESGTCPVCKIAWVE